MKITVTGATGLIGPRLVAELKDRGDEVTVLSREPDRARERLGVEAVAWDAARAPRPVEALEGRDAVVHLAGEPVAQRWNAAGEAAHPRVARARHANLVAGLRAADPRPRVLVSAGGRQLRPPRRRAR